MTSDNYSSILPLDMNYILKLLYVCAKEDCSNSLLKPTTLKGYPLKEEEQWHPLTSLLTTSGFWPRVRARALRAPVISTFPRQTGRALRT
jgi:hypothetical protein